MRAREPDAAGAVRRDGVEVHWERFGAGDPAVLFLGVDPIVESRMWKGQVPWLARSHAVVTFDPPGNGRSSRPIEPQAYVDDVFVGAALDVLDAAGVERAVAVGVCQGAGIAIVLAAEHPDRVAGVVAINPGLVLAPRGSHRAPGGFDVRRETYEGWEKENRHYWRQDWVDFSDFFFDQLLPEPHSTKQHEDCVGWASSTSADVMLAYCEPSGLRDDPSTAADLCRRVRAPVLVICGDQDMCQPPDRARRVAELTGGDLLVLEGAGHLPFARDPVRVNLEIQRFLARV